MYSSDMVKSIVLGRLTAVGTHLVEVFEVCQR